MAGKLKILFVIPTLTAGGAERVIINLVKGINKEIFDVHLAVLDNRNAVFLEDIPVDVIFHDLNVKRVRHGVLRLFRLIARLKPQVIFSTLSHLNLALAIFKPFIRKKTVLIARETIVLSYGINEYKFRAVWNFLFKVFYNNVDFLVCQSQDMQMDLVNNFRIKREKTKVINNPCDAIGIREKILSETIIQKIPLINKHNDTLNLVSVGRLVHQKGFDLLLDAFSKLNNKNIKLTIIGDGPLREELEAIAKNLDIDERVSFLGFVKDPYKIIRDSDAFILPSRYEGFPNIVLEALACGTPVIATPAPGGIKEILSNRDECVISESISGVSLAEAIIFWINGDKARVPLEASEPYSLSHIIKKYQDLFIECSLT